MLAKTKAKISSLLRLSIAIVILSFIIFAVVYIIYNQPVNLAGSYVLHEQPKVVNSPPDNVDLIQYLSAIILKLTKTSDGYLARVYDGSPGPVVFSFLHSDTNQYSVNYVDTSGSVVFEFKFEATRRTLAGLLYISRFRSTAEISLQKQDVPSVNIIALILYIIFGVIFFHQFFIRAIRIFYHAPDPVIFSFWNDSKPRLALQPPSDILRIARLKPGMIVMDLGCGTGSMTIPIAKELGREGTLYAVDVQDRVLRKLKTRLNTTARAVQDIIIPIQADAHRLPFKTDSIDVVVMVSSLWEMENPHAVLREVSRVLGPNGYLVVSEYGFDPDYIYRESLHRFFSQTDFVLRHELHYFVTYTLSAEPSAGSMKEYVKDSDEHQKNLCFS